MQTNEVELLKNELITVRNELNNLKQQVRNLQHVQHKDIESSNDDDDDTHNVLAVAENTNDTNINENHVNNCENCRDCICKPWRLNLTPEYVALFRLQLDCMNKYLSKTDPLAIQASKKLDKNFRQLPVILLNYHNQCGKNNDIELFPNTGIFVTENGLNLAVSNANGKYRNMVRQLLSLVVTDEQLAAYKTAGTMNQTNPNIRYAIIGYLKNEWNFSLSTTEFNDIVRRRIELVVRNQKPPEELEKVKKQSIERAWKSREKRKLLQRAAKTVLKKEKGQI